MRFEKYFQPETLEECVEILCKYPKGEARVLAGGTDLVPRLKMGILQPKAVIGMMMIPDIAEITVSDEGLTLGTLANLRDISLCAALNQDFLVVKECCGHVSSLQVRDMATIGGNACNANPSADAIHGLILHDAMATTFSQQGSRTMPILDFFVAPGKNALLDGEVLLRLFLPKPKSHTGAAYHKFAIRGDSDISIVGAGARLTLGENGTLSDARISLGAVAPTPMRAQQAEALLVGKNPSAELFAQAADLASGEACPISDQRASREYREEMIRVWVRHALEEALERAQHN